MDHSRFFCLVLTSFQKVEKVAIMPFPQLDNVVLVSLSSFMSWWYSLFTSEPANDQSDYSLYRNSHSLCQMMPAQLASSFRGTPQVLSSNPHGADFRLRVKKSPRSSQVKAQVKRWLGSGLPVCAQVKRQPSYGAWLPMYGWGEDSEIFSICVRRSS
jgi:hypothetical protein